MKKTVAATASLGLVALVVAATLILPGCVQEQPLKNYASGPMRCPPEQIEIQVYEYKGRPNQFRATGCDQSETFGMSCDLLGHCGNFTQYTTFSEGVE